MKSLALLAAVLACGCSEKVIRAGTFVTGGLIACDLGQTYYASNDGKWNRPGIAPGTVQVELNPLLGYTPSPHMLLMTGIIGIGANTAIGLSGLPRWARSAYLITVGVVEGYIIATHVDTAGVCGSTGEIK